ncbi:MAG: (2Fe-2S)-binding protein [Oscillospiraceae bacterium]|nr:(2Fe-2S)-binding protein [Oscillospiraceae bacterium]
MGYMTIDGCRVEFTDEPNILAVIRKAGIEIPTLCYHSELSVYGACRLCTCEDARGRTFASCSEKPADGMVIYTNTPRLINYRRTIVELMLASHDRDCTTCQRSGECELQDLARRLSVKDVRFDNYRKHLPIDSSSPSIVRDPNKCILCGDCVRMCENVQHVSAIDIANRGTKAVVTPAFGKSMAESGCVNCGQCRVVCPTSAITIHTAVSQVMRELADPDTYVIAQVAPAVRVAIGDKLGLPEGQNNMGKLVAVLHRLGFDEVYDTTYGADLTVMEEAAEFLDRIRNHGTLPLFTSCCPAWVQFCEERYPDLFDHLSTCRSPQAMFGAVIRQYYREHHEQMQGKKRLVSVSIMPCTAKKAEILRPESHTFGEQDIDYVLTTTEIAALIQRTGYRFDRIEPEAPDVPFGVGSGGGVIFGVTGGVTEAVLRRITSGKSRRDMDAIKTSGVRGPQGVKEFSVEYEGHTLHIAVISGLANADRVMRAVRAGEAHYDLIEVMACPSGCVNGGGQPVGAVRSSVEERAGGLYKADVNYQIQRSNDNPLVVALYDGMLKGREHTLLHRNFSQKKQA